MVNVPSSVIVLSVITSPPMVKSVVASIVPPAIAPVVVIAPEPTLIEVNPEVIEPASNAPTVTRLAVEVIAAWVPPVLSQQFRLHYLLHYLLSALQIQ